MKAAVIRFCFAGASGCARLNFGSNQNSRSARAFDRSCAAGRFIQNSGVVPKLRLSRSAVPAVPAHGCLVPAMAETRFGGTFGHFGIAGGCWSIPASE
jgi:hypothetical protein